MLHEFGLPVGSTGAADVEWVGEDEPPGGAELEGDAEQAVSATATDAVSATAPPMPRAAIPMTTSLVINGPFAAVLEE
jgi:hypothetical protein